MCVCEFPSDGGGAVGGGKWFVTEDDDGDMDIGSDGDV